MAISDQLISSSGVGGRAVFLCGRCLIPVEDKNSQSKFSKVCQNCGVLGEWDSEARRDVELAPIIGDVKRARRWARFRFRLRVAEGEYKGFYVCEPGIGVPVDGTRLTLHPQELASTLYTEKGANESLAILEQRGLKIEVIENI
jgi:hypothetical protein